MTRHSELMQWRAQQVVLIQQVFPHILETLVETGKITPGGVQIFETALDGLEMMRQKPSDRDNELLAQVKQAKQVFNHLMVHLVKTGSVTHGSEMIAQALYDLRLLDRDLRYYHCPRGTEF